jgi:hypothetical protein
VTSSEGIAGILSAHFERADNPVDLVRFERLSSRKMVVRNCEVTFWHKKQL